MRILELYLENFSRVFTGLGKTKLTIDLRNTTNRIHLIVGDNGTGKTSIMSCFHPFAFNNNMDNRDNNELILEDKNGEKIIIIEDGDIIYNIRHIYKRTNTGITVRSYISDGTLELNPAGNVTQFKELILELFGLDDTFFSLLTLGVNVNGFISKSGADRKNFSVKIFEQLGIYNVYYKRITNNAKVLKALITNISSKLVKYKNLDLDTLKKTLMQLEQREKKLYDEILYNSSEIGSVNSLIDTKRDLIETYESKQRELSILLDDLNNLKNNRKTKLNLSDLKDLIKDCDIKKYTYDSKIINIEDEISNTLDNINNKEDSRLSINTNKSKLTSNENLDDLIRLDSEMSIDINELEKELNGVNLSGYNREDLIRSTVYLDELMNQCGDLLLVDNELSLKVYKKYINDNKFEHTVNKSIVDNTFNIRNYELIKANGITDIDTRLDSDCENDGCPYKKFYKLYIDTLKENNKNTIYEMNKVRETVGSLETILDIIAVIKRCNKFVNDNNGIFSSLPKDVFDIDNYIEGYITTREIYNKDRLVYLIDKLEKDIRLKSLIDKRTTLKDKIEHYKNSQDVLDNMETELNSITQSIIELNNKLNKLRTEVQSIKLEKNDIDNLLNKYNTELVVLESINKVKTRMDILSDEIRSMYDNIKDIELLKSKLNKFKLIDTELSNERNKITNEMNNIRLTISDYESLKQEEAEISIKYDKYTAIRDAVSPSKGIPTTFIEAYTKNIAEYMNELLDLVYYGSLRICSDDIVVDDNEFSIPYVKNGTKIKDISKASQGERAFLSLAFSLSMIRLASDDNGSDLFKYNIMLLDEADTTLDNVSRGKFIPIVESYLDSIGAEQVFIISHNNMFDAYPVELITTSQDVSSFGMVNNIIKLY